jgi:hypothetical protein
LLATSDCKSGARRSLKDTSSSERFSSQKALVLCVTKTTVPGTGSPYDVAITEEAYLWVAVFDHAQTRHSWHMRPLAVRFKSSP